MKKGIITVILVMMMSMTVYSQDFKPITLDLVTPEQAWLFDHYELAKTDGDDIIALCYTFTNVSSDPMEPGDRIMHILYQDGQELDLSYADSNNPELEELDMNTIKSVKDGSSIDVAYIFKLNNTSSPIEVILRDTDTMLETTTEITLEQEQKKPVRKERTAEERLMELEQKIQELEARIKALEN